MKRKKFSIANDKIKVIIFCLLVSFLILSITSKCSFLYPFNDWGDANSFFTVGKSMFNGIVPYKGIFEQKGPLLYFIYGLGYLISHKSFLGVFVLEVATWTFSLYYFFKTINIYLSKSLSLTIIPLFMTLICVSKAFAHGGGAEEFCLPFYAITLYFFLKHFKNEDTDYKTILIAGFCAGCVLLIKYTLLGFWFAFMATIFFDYIFKRKYKKGFISCIYFLLGMFLPIIVFLIYFGINNAIGDFYNVYFKVNITAYNRHSINLFSKIYTIFLGFTKLTLKNGFFISLLLLGMPIFLIEMDITRKAKICIFVNYIISIIGLFWGIRFYRYYLFPMFIFILPSLIVIFSLIDKKFNFSKYKITILISIIIALIGSYNGANYKKMIMTKKKDLFQYEYAEIINRESNPTLLNIGFLDCGLYTTTGIVPSTYFFEKHNIPYASFPDNLDSLNRYVEQQKTEFVVYFSKKKLDREKETNLFMNYDLIKENKIIFENKKFNTYLFKKKYSKI